VIVIPERVVFLKVPKAASTTIANLFFEKYKVAQNTTLTTDVATAVQCFSRLEQLADRLPVLNGNWFFNRASAFGWHSSFQDLSGLFGAQLEDYHWVASIRHPVPRLFSIFSYQVAKKRISAALCASDFERFCQAVFRGDNGLTVQQRIHAWPQSRWLPKEGHVARLSLVRQTQVAEDIRRLGATIPGFAHANLGQINCSFSGSLAPYIDNSLANRIMDHYRQDMERFQFDDWETTEPARFSPQLH
jgi:hypothetical protein